MCAWHFADFSFLQGLNRLAAIALLFLNEEDAFWCLVCIIEFIMPQEYYTTTLLAAQVDQVRQVQARIQNVEIGTL